MNPEPVIKFFRLNLDNVFRFVCSALFILAFAGHSSGLRPLEQLASLLEWLAIPGEWLRPVAGWIDQRSEFTVTVATISLVVALGFAAACGWETRAGSTALLSMAVIAQAGQFGTMVGGLFGIVVLVAAVTISVGFVTRRMGIGSPTWIGVMWRKIASTGMGLVMAILSVASPFGWLVSDDYLRVRGTRHDPVYIAQTGDDRPSGAIPRSS